MKINHIDLGKHPILLAPMEDVTDPAFRLMCKKFGADMVYTEFVSSDALIRAVSKTAQKLNISDEERPVAIQIYGKDTETMVEAAKIVEQAQPDILDINFGCPVKRVAGKGAGAGMLQNIPQMLEITRAVVDAVKIPVTVKTRLGWDANNKIIVELAEQLQDCGIAALTIHGRTRAQMYTGEADWTLIGEVKNNPRMHIPIIGNGDVTTPQRCKECFDRYGVDAVMIGRASFGRPWIFKEMKHYLETGEEMPPLSSEWKLPRPKRSCFRYLMKYSPTEKVARKIKYDIYSIASLKIVLWSNAILFEHRLRKPLFKHPSYHHIQQECGEKAYNSINDIMSLNIYSSSTKQHIERYQASKQLLTAPPCHNHQNGRNADMRTWKCGRRPFAHLLGAFH